MISVVIPVFNEEKYLRTALESVLFQTVTDMEVICIDDGSTDGTARIIADIQTSDSRIRYFHQKNMGLGAARNHGLDKCRGDYVFFMDADDILVPNAMEVLLGLLKRHGADISIGLFRWIYETPLGVKTVNPVQEFIYNGDCAFAYAEETQFCGSAWGKLYKKEIIGGTRFSSIKCCEDVEFNIQIFAKAGKVVRTPAELYLYRQVESSLVHDKRHFEWSFEACLEISRLCMRLRDKGEISTKAAVALIRQYGTCNIMIRILQLCLATPHRYSQNEYQDVLAKGRTSLYTILAEDHPLEQQGLLQTKYRIIYLLTFRLRSACLLLFFAKLQEGLHRSLQRIKNNNTCLL